MSTVRVSSTLHTRINYWPAMIDMLTSLLMFFLLIYFVEQNFSSASAQLAVARQKQSQFSGILEREFAPEIAAGQIGYIADLKLLQVRFGEGVLFLPGEHELLPQGRRLLGRLARVFHSVNADSTHPYEQIQIEGHTDNVPARRSYYPHDNWELSTARATSVLRFLTRGARQPLDEKLMSVNGYADNRPANKNRRNLNRRIEIRIYFSGGAPPGTPGARP
ncbi:OmpA/MotB family protein [Longimicrobium terrae]|uniref:Flagellar motor protein MotB n=1 Tax=Longimicrobium terrae TaxID=1639882 RepID=A0A841H3C6_9BACT|nr:OmpA family protein [Longimicrobium terrae]MBB4638132.1 flagellar motor protein MotB [Longimicrobium terrae]MBB6072504.1 flagellar motor protein MotB [Longimicrobium terrae]NNC32086.1 OmpA family protein [Longimicrobium terrae]